MILHCQLHVWVKLLERLRLFVSLPPTRPARSCVRSIILVSLGWLRRQKCVCACSWCAKKLHVCGSNVAQRWLIDWLIDVAFKSRGYVSSNPWPSVLTQCWPITIVHRTRENPEWFYRPFQFEEIEDRVFPSVNWGLYEPKSPLEAQNQEVGCTAISK